MPAVSNSYYDFFDPKYVPIGFVFPFCSANLPYEFAECNGVILPKSSYGKLYSTIGTMYGGVVGVSCALPDYREYFFRCISGLVDVDPDKNNRNAGLPGTPMGNNVGSKQLSYFRAHYHTIDYWRAWTTGDRVAGDTRPLLSNDSYSPTGGPATKLAAQLTANNIPGATETIPKNIGVVYAMRVI